MALFRTLHPDMRISLNVVNREMLLQHLKENIIDLALMGQPPEGRDLAARPFMDNPLVVIAATGHPLAGSHKIPLSRLLEEPLVGRELGSGTRVRWRSFSLAVRHGRAKPEADSPRKA